MLVAGLPYKFATPWAADAASGFITSVIPATASGPVASQQLGFPPATSEAIAAGGTPPNIADFNGAYFYTTSWLQWLQAGGPVFYDAAFSTAIGGYPKGATLNSIATNGAQWISTVDNNTSNPDTGGANWTTIGAIPHTWSAQQVFSTSPVLTNNIPLLARDASGTTRNMLVYSSGNVVVVTGGQSGFVINNNAGSANNLVLTDAGAVTFRAGGAFGGAVTVNGPVTIPNNASLLGKDTAGTTHNLISYTSSNAVILSGGQAGWVVNNNANTINNLVLDDFGNGTFHGFVAGANANSSNQATMLGQFASSMSATAGYQFLPSGLLMQWGAPSTPVPIDNVSHVYNFPTAFPNGAFVCLPQCGAFGPAIGAMMGGQPVNNAQFEVTVASATPGGSLGFWFIAVGF